MADFANTKASIEAQFPTWMVWRSDAGHWYATRAGSLTDQQLLSGYARTVAADSAESLRALLHEQTRPDEGAG